MVELLRWTDLIAYLEARHAGVQTFPGDRFRFEYVVEGGAVRFADGAPIVFGGYGLRAPGGAPWVALALKLAPHEEMRPRPALVANSDLPVGALVAIAEFAVLRQTLPLQGLRAGTLEATLRALARLAGDLRAAREPADGGDAFDATFAYIYR